MKWRPDLPSTVSGLPALLSDFRLTPKNLDPVVQMNYGENFEELPPFPSIGSGQYGTPVPGKGAAS
jgi:hypothetical protein